MPSCKWHTFWMASCLICYFIVILFYIERTWLPMRNLAIILPLKSELSGKFQRFNAIDKSINILKNSWISKNFDYCKMKNFKTFYENQSASLLKEIIQPPHSLYHQIKSYYVFETKIFIGRYTEIQKNLKAVLWRQEIVQCK